MVSIMLYGKCLVQLTVNSKRKLESLFYTVMTNLLIRGKSMAMSDGGSVSQFSLSQWVLNVIDDQLPCHSFTLLKNVFYPCTSDYDAVTKFPSSILRLNPHGALSAHVIMLISGTDL